MPLITYVEARFIEAEAALRSGNNARAQTAYTEALTAALNRYDGIDAAGVTAAYLAANGTLGSSPLAQIMFQNGFPAILNLEAWSDWRRTNFNQRWHLIQVALFLLFLSDILQNKMKDCITRMLW